MLVYLFAGLKRENGFRVRLLDKLVYFHSFISMLPSINTLGLIVCFENIRMKYLMSFLFFWVNFK